MPRDAIFAFSSVKASEHCESVKTVIYYEFDSGFVSIFTAIWSIVRLIDIVKKI